MINDLVSGAWGFHLKINRSNMKILTMFTLLKLKILSSSARRIRILSRKVCIFVSVVCEDGKVKFLKFFTFPNCSWKTAASCFMLWQPFLLSSLFSKTNFFSHHFNIIYFIMLIVLACFRFFIVLEAFIVVFSAKPLSLSIVSIQWKICYIKASNT